MRIGNYFLFLKDSGFCIIKNAADAVASAVFPNAPKGRKGEKEIGHSKPICGAQSPEERECRRESESLNPMGFSPRRRGFPLCPLTNRNVIHFLVFVKYFCQNYFILFPNIGIKAKKKPKIWGK